ncbi:MAG: COP23 domain-containing protein [Hormoscilla sp.]
MKCKFLSQTILAAAAVTVSAVTAIGEPASATELRFGCEDIDGVVTTVATETQTGERNSLFYWHDDALRQSEDPQKKCQPVSDKLQAALATGGDDLSIQVEKVGGLPVVCLKEKDRAGCGEILFSASSTRNLNRIYPQNQGSRGVQEYGQPVTLWELLGLSRRQSQGQRSRNLVSPNQ